jgi:uncharacterized membrane protein YdjX (TVP38/TMEM64 family)
MLGFVRARVVPLALTAGACVALYFGSRAIPEDRIRAALDAAGAGGPALFCVLMLVPNVVAPLSSSPLLFVGFRLFGQNVVLYAAAAGLLASLLNFWIARRLGRHVVERLIGHEPLARADRFMVKRGLFLLLVLRVFNGGVYKFVAYAAGLTAMRFRPFAAVSAIGMVPGTLVWYAVASRVDDALTFTAVSFAIGLTLSTAFAVGSAVISLGRRPRRLREQTVEAEPARPQVNVE